jgi:uncharacterized membrane protein YcaP (DUF421 family)
LELAFQIPTFETILQLICISILVSVGSFFIVRISGKKSVSQMTLPTMVIIISLGSLITTPVQSDKSIIGTLISVLTFITVLLIMEYFSLNSKKSEKTLDSVPTLLIKDGMVIKDNLKKERITMEQLKSFLRENGISNFSEVRTCLLETSGKIGYEKATNNKQKKSSLFDDYR